MTQSLLEKDTAKQSEESFILKHHACFDGQLPYCFQAGKTFCRDYIVETKQARANSVKIEITCSNDAFKRTGKSQSITVVVTKEGVHSHNALNELANRLNCISVKELFDCLVETSHLMDLQPEVNVVTKAIPNSSVYSPFCFENLKAISQKEIHKDWTSNWGKNYLTRALANGQFYGLKKLYESGPKLNLIKSQPIEMPHPFGVLQCVNTKAFLISSVTKVDTGLEIGFSTNDCDAYVVNIDVYKRFKS